MLKSPARVCVLLAGLNTPDNTPAIQGRSEIRPAEGCEAQAVYQTRAPGMKQECMHAQVSVHRSKQVAWTTASPGGDRKEGEEKHT